ncbi:hypothetical protein SDRG_12350 [Saprolegnia diclina VS20]|uniref:methionine--tRNA ligase n=1 Tax=Saprolegnia diclina (strain VS20) TaxID=1156394 RepID=T0PW96_SAPDV|nr:hypothetical protein SDRG_12350 [Saprolegnia diclina VS20]EQC29804.1 hypothetical protein SDRG_12350 [Saprolegnia diclina VS20]|eukprot:XP_008616643.1 hypothetical protein SDRG_12350 [Saprolegnia diclina VS20]
MDALQAKVQALNLKSQAEDRAAMDAETQAAAAQSFYITTAIHYSNGVPHIGHAYENVTADVIARYHRAYGRDVRFLTGTDEHGQKIAQTAEAAGMTPQQLCDKYSGLFQQLTKDLNMSNDDFIRTTSDRHKSFCQYIFGRAQANGDIYKGTYEGWYNVREETFVTENEAAQTNYKDPTSGLDLKKMQEESYFFKMSKYQKRLVEHFHAHPEFLQPETARQAILKRLEEPLHDLSASRTTFSHGIPLPDDPKHVMYVWFDALSNYLSALDYPNNKELSKFWPASVHIIGKDITWFHTVIWPCILMSAGFPLPKRVFAHGFINAKDGTKMSKSIGNVVDPYDMVAKVGLDSFRYFVVRGARYGADMPFSEDELMAMHNSDLADTLGNLVHRGLTLSVKYADGTIPDAVATPCFDVAALRAATEDAYQNYNLQDACIAFIEAVKETNKYLTDAAPWHMTDAAAKLVVVRTVLEAVYIFAHFMTPFMPGTADAIFAKLHTQPKTLTQLSSYFDNLTHGTPIVVGDILFQKVLSDAEKAALEAKKTPAPAPVKAKKVELPLFASTEIRVGTITKVWPHPDSDKLFCEEIDVGRDAPVQIASGLRPFYSAEEMTNRKVLVLLNIKAAKLAGFKSNGMVLCACNEARDVIQFVEPPAGAVNGERVTIATESGDPVSEGQMKKQKVWEKLAIDLKTNDKAEATYKGVVIMTSAGPCKAASLTNVFIS